MPRRRIVATVLVIQCLLILAHDTLDGLTMLEMPLVERKVQKDSASIVRVCVATREQTYVACLGVIIAADMVVTSKSCESYLRKLKQVEMYAAANKMDCRNGQLRTIEEVLSLKSLLGLRPTTPFTLSPQLAVMRWNAGDNLDVDKCWTYCSQRITKKKGVTTIKKNTCKVKLWKHPFDFVSCNRTFKPPEDAAVVPSTGPTKMFSDAIEPESPRTRRELYDWEYPHFKYYHPQKPKPSEKSTTKPIKSTTKRPPHKPPKDKDCQLAQEVIEPPAEDNTPRNCGSIAETDTPCKLTNFQPSMSVIICDHKLHGFIQNKQNNPYLLQIVRLSDNLHDINNVTEACNC
ncbi:hypothetical protein Trydic_g2865 [Trypoxylus dichotomus]